MDHGELYAMIILDRMKPTLPAEVWVLLVLYHQQMLIQQCYTTILWVNIFFVFHYFTIIYFNNEIFTILFLN